MVLLYDSVPQTVVQTPAPAHLLRWRWKQEQGFVDATPGERFLASTTSSDSGLAKVADNDVVTEARRGWDHFKDTKLDLSDVPCLRAWREKCGNIGILKRISRFLWKPLMLGLSRSPIIIRLAWSERQTTCLEIRLSSSPASANKLIYCCQIGQVIERRTRSQWWVCSRYQLCETRRTFLLLYELVWPYVTDVHSRGVFAVSSKYHGSKLAEVFVCMRCIHQRYNIWKRSWFRWEISLPR